MTSKFRLASRVDWQADFDRHADKVEGISLRGETMLPPAFMVKRFGKHDGGDGIRVSGGWSFVGDSGEVLPSTSIGPPPCRTGVAAVRRLFANSGRSGSRSSSTSVGDRARTGKRSADGSRASIGRSERGPRTLVFENTDRADQGLFRCSIPLPLTPLPLEVRVAVNRTAEALGGVGIDRGHVVEMPIMTERLSFSVRFSPGLRING